jgi:hypothetical protein
MGHPAAQPKREVTKLCKKTNFFFFGVGNSCTSAVQPVRARNKTNNSRQPVCTPHSLQFVCCLYCTCGISLFLSFIGLWAHNTYLLHLVPDSGFALPGWLTKAKSKAKVCISNVFDVYACNQFFVILFIIIQSPFHSDYVTQAPTPFISTLFTT